MEEGGAEGAVGRLERGPSGSSPVLTFGDFGLCAPALPDGLHITREGPRALGH